MDTHKGGVKLLLYILVLTIHLFLLRDVKAQQFIDCDTQHTSCSCTTSEGKVIDLSPIDSQDPTNPLFFDQYDEQYLDQYSWNPCSDFTEDPTGCNNIAACQHSSSGIFYPLGDQTSAQFINDPTDGLSLTYSGVGPDSGTRTSFVQLICDENVDPPTLDVKGEDQITPGNYHMSLTSKYCCPQGDPQPPASTTSGTIVITVTSSISIGTIMCIVFAVIVPIYIIGGIAIKKTRMGASGVEMVPNVVFWQSLPGLVKDGTMFVVGKVSRKGYQAM